jgi:hypothetical protein
MYGRVWILLAALMAFRTGLGALAGAMAVPPGWRRAFPLGAVGGVVTLPGDPIPPVWAVAGTATASEATRTSPASPSFRLVDFDRKPFSFVGLRG